MNRGEEEAGGSSTHTDDPLVGKQSGNMEINNHLTHLSQKDLPPSSSLLYMAPQLNLSDPDIQAQLANMDKYYKVQEETLIRQFKQQRMMLHTEQQIKMNEQQSSSALCSMPLTNSRQVQLVMLQKQQQLDQAMAEQKLREQMDKARADHEEVQLDRIKNKRSDQQSAVASDSVKARLRECLLLKNTTQNRDPNLKNSPPTLRSWTTQHSSLEQHSPPTSGLSPPLQGPQLVGCYDDEYPLRKTVSEPNLKMMRPKLASQHRQQASLHPLHSPRMSRHSQQQQQQLRKHHSNSNALFTSEPNLKVRLALKQRMIERRSSPLLKRRDRHNPMKRNTNTLTVNTGLPNSNPDSGPNTPPSSSLASQGASTDVPPTGEKDRAGFPLQMMSKMVINQSMPNLALAHQRPAPGGDSTAAGLVGHDTAALQTEADIRARNAKRYGLPLTSHMMTGPLPYYHIPTVLEGQNPADPAFIEAQMKALELARSTGQLPQMGAAAAAMANTGLPAMLPMPAGMAEAQQYGSKLSRTHSAPLPLPGQLMHHQMLLQQQEMMMKESNPKHYLKQKLQSSILHRSGSKSHMEDVDEEAEARLAQEMKDIKEKEEEVLVIEDKQHHKQRSETVTRPPLTAHEALLQKLRGGESSSSQQQHRSGSSGEKLQRARSYPTVRTSPPILEHANSTGLAFDSLMLKHACICGDISAHPENPGRIHSIYTRLQEAGILHKCERLESRKATLEEIKSCHSEAYALLYGSSPQKLAESRVDPKMFEPLLQRFCKLSCGGVGVDADTVWNETQTPTAARIAAGTVIDLAFRVACESLKNGFALVRPPGHHAEPTLAMGFCYFNSVSIAAKQLLNKLSLKKILILDWDVHHGNSTQQIFYADPRVLYISLHRHDNGNFFPGTGAPDECGIDRGLGYNVNVSWSGRLNPPMGDAEYMTAFRTIVMPIAREFKPEIVLVSAGFDGASGHSPQLGGYNISPACFGHMTKQLMTLGTGKIVLSLEGGYHLPSICDSAEMCFKALLGEEIPELKQEELLRPCCQPALDTLETTLRCQAKYWTSLRRYAHTIRWSLAETAKHNSEDADTVSQMASLSVVKENSNSPSEESTPQIIEPTDESTEPMEQA